MSILLSLLLAQAARVLPEIDRSALDRQARAEARQGSRPVQSRPAGVTAPRANRAAAQAARPAARSAAVADRRTVTPQRPAALRRASGGALDLSEITTICRTASERADRAAYLTTIARARSLSAADGASLRIGCAAYLAGRTDARVNSGDTPGL